MSLDGKKKKEVIALSVLGVFAAYMVYSNLLAGPSIPASEHVAAPAVAADGGPLSMPGAVAKKGISKTARTSRGREDAFHPVYLNARIEDRPDPTKIDPTLHLEQFAKLQEVEPAGGRRNLFVFGAPPPPKPAELPKTEPVVKITDAKGGRGGRGGPPPPVPGGPGGGEVPLHIDLKYYGIIAYSRGGGKTACFMDGEEILTATEGDTLKRRYRVVRIGTTSVVMEDTESKRQATLPIEKEAQA